MPFKAYGHESYQLPLTSVCMHLTGNSDGIGIEQIQRQVYLQPPPYRPVVLKRFFKNILMAFDVC